ncbi:MULTISPECIES: hypothetical protein [Hyphomonas]|uniref:Uncharacterized protein n=1 Tax=Hyphomonas adhaerens TaxID=81029 RepID=A0A3B9GTP9_9PROT|nr:MULTISPECIES: hypothetical protein [Hyphomonas]MBB39359.1 hypothetical protein [Hyphomonas sp.]HAE25738.1 hypothetical protein [Hyphomonas adhaerens]
MVSAFYFGRDVNADFITIYTGRNIFSGQMKATPMSSQNKQGKPGKPSPPPMPQSMQEKRAEQARQQGKQDKEQPPKN